MADAAEPIAKVLRRAILVQLLLTLLIAAGFLVFQERSKGVASALAAAYGGAVTMVISAWLAWITHRYTASARQLMSMGLGGIAFGNVMRYALAVLLLAFGLGVLRLSPLPMVIAFAVTQFGFMAAHQRG